MTASLTLQGVLVYECNKNNFKINKDIIIKISVHIYHGIETAFT